MKGGFIGRRRRRIVRRPARVATLRAGGCRRILAVLLSPARSLTLATAPVTPSRFSWCAHAIHNRLPCSSRADGDADNNSTSDALGHNCRRLLRIISPVRKNRYLFLRPPARPSIIR